MKNVIKRLLREELLKESKNTETQGKNILLKNKEISEAEADEIIKAFAKGDKSKNQKNIPVMAFIYAKWNNNNIDQIIELLNEFNDLEDKKRIKPLNLTKEGISIGNEKFTDYLGFSEFIHGETTKSSKNSVTNYNISSEFKAEKKPLWSGNNIDIYEGDKIEKCIAYTTGALTDRAYSFCIGKAGPTNMYKSYRDTKTSTFYFIVDRNRFKKNEDGTLNLDDPLHIVVLDSTKYGYELTDADNRTGNIAEYGGNVEGYINYLKEKKVPVDKIFVNKPKTKEEEKEDEKLGKRNTSLEWFKGLTFDEKSSYIGRGFVLTDEQFDYLYGV